MSDLSLWQAQHDWVGFAPVSGAVRTDVAVIGAGVTGASAARRLADHGLAVVVLDARTAAGGASGRNGGFATAGTELAHSELVRRIGAGPAADLHAFTERALDEMLVLAVELGVPQAVRRTGGLWLADGGEQDELEESVEALTAAGVECRLAPELMPEPLRRHYQTAAVFPRNGDIMPAAWVRALVTDAAARGVVVHEASAVAAIEGGGEAGWTAHTAGGRVDAQAVLVACDGLIPAIAPELEGIVYPVRGQMLATEPLTDTVVTMPTHCDHGFFYFRPTVDGRLALGGGRRASLESEYTAEEHTTDAVQAALDRFLAERLGLGGARVARRWAGIMGFSADLLPLVGELPGRPGLYVSGGYSGVGNVQGYACGQIAADLIAVGSHPQSPPYRPERFVVDGRLQPAADQLEKSASRAAGGATGSGAG
jgi:glycine/D-amino acid oxidase-like deaminating enzyme